MRIGLIASVVLCSHWVGATGVSAQSLDGSLVLGLETPLVRYERTELERTDDGFEFDYGSADPSTRYSIVSVGLASDAHASYAVAGPVLVGGFVGYAFARALVVGLRLGVGFGSGGGEETEYSHWTFAAGPRAAYVFGEGWFRPFVGLEAGVSGAKTSGDEGLRVEQSALLWSVGPTGGLHVFASPAVSFDARVALGYAAGEQSQTLYLGTIEQTQSTMQPVVVGDVSQESAVSRLEAMLALGVSAWL